MYKCQLKFIYITPNEVSVFFTLSTLIGLRFFLFFFSSSSKEYTPSLYNNTFHIHIVLFQRKTSHLVLQYFIESVSIVYELYSIQFEYGFVILLYFFFR